MIELAELYIIILPFVIDFMNSAHDARCERCARTWRRSLRTRRGTLTYAATPSREEAERVKNQCSCMIDDGDDGETQRRETLNI